MSMRSLQAVHDCLDVLSNSYVASVFHPAPMTRFSKYVSCLRAFLKATVPAVLLMTQVAIAQQSKSTGISIAGKPSGGADRKYAFMNANNIAVKIFNYGSIAPGIGLSRHVDNFVWNGLGDLFTAGPVVGAEVKDASGRPIHILSDGINDVYARDVNPLNNSNIYGWEPLPGCANPNQGFIATSDNPESWPSEWTSWPGLQGAGKILGKKEAYYVMDDRDNSEFQYFPFPGDSVKRGLGLEVEGRIYQFDDPDFSDVLFTLYTIANVSPKLLPKVTAGFYIDVDVGGGYPIFTAESQDDLGFFDAQHDLVYFWDNDGIGNYGLRTHYTGVMLIETPGNPNDGIDNDGDGIVDESQSNGIDDDGDWDPGTDDVGMDGIAGTHDPGEGDGVPTAGIRLLDGRIDPLHPGEPNFEMRDREESDELGLTSFVAWTWGDQDFNLSTDSIAWNHMHHGLINAVPQITDIASLFSSGDFSLAPGFSTHFTSAFVAAWDLNGVLRVVDKISDQYDSRFYTGEGGNKSLAMHIDAPLDGQSVGGDVQVRWTSSGIVKDRLVDIWFSNSYLPSWNLLAHDLPDNGLYAWDTKSLRDGSWYKLRVVGKKNGDRGFDISRDYFTINNPGNGAPDIFLLNQFRPIPVHDTLMLHWAAGDPDGDFLLFRIQMSSDGGATFASVDSVTNTHEYLLDTHKLPNSYSTVIRLEAFDGAVSSYSQSTSFVLMNTYVQIKDSAITHPSGHATGLVRPIVIDSSALTGHSYQVSFDSAGGALYYSVRDLSLNQLRIHHQLLGAFTGGGTYFDGMRIGFRAEKLDIDSAQSGFVNSSTTNLTANVAYPTLGVTKLAPIDVKVVFNAMDTTIDGKYLFPGDTLFDVNLSKKVIAPFRITNMADNFPLEAVVTENQFSAAKRWDPGEKIDIRTPLEYRSVLSNIAMELRFDPPVDPLIKPSIKGGEIFIGRMKRPFTTEDVYEFVASKSNTGPMRVRNAEGVPVTFSLDQNYPNPFNPCTNIRFAIAESRLVRLAVFDLLGREVATLLYENLPPGNYSVQWDGTNFSSGVYVYRLQTGNFVATKKMILLK